jgi:hypothetical protein
LVAAKGEVIKAHRERWDTYISAIVRDAQGQQNKACNYETSE